VILFCFTMHLLSVQLSLAASSNSISRVLNFVNLSVCVHFYLEFSGCNFIVA
jgi:hypothetical protein